MCSVLEMITKTEIQPELVPVQSSQISVQEKSGESEMDELNGTQTI